MKIIVSACLLGENCKYNGGNNHCPAVVEFVKGHTVIPVCPEMEAGMGCPRIPVEIRNGILTDKNGNDVDAPMRRVIEKRLSEFRGQEIDCAILKSRSPTCGVRQVYDGTFTGRLVDGAGLFAGALKEAGYRVIDSEDI